MNHRRIDLRQAAAPHSTDPSRSNHQKRPRRLKNWIVSALAVTICPALVTSVGCGEGQSVAKTPATTNNSVASNTAPMATTNPSMAAANANSANPNSTNPNAATGVVSGFLDAIRRGGGDNPADKFLTARAKDVLQKIGHSLQPLGSPDARFNVIGAFDKPEFPGEAIVRATWLEPDTEAGQLQMEVACGVRYEENGWKISGMAIQMSDGSTPITYLDFEDQELMTQAMNGMSDEASASPAATTASTKQGNSGF